MAPKSSPKKAITNEDRVKTRCIRDKDGFLRQHNNSEESKKIIKAFEENGLLYLVTFAHKRAYKKEIALFYLNAVIERDGTISSMVGEKEITITREDISEEFQLPATYDFDISSHSFNQKLFWDEIKIEYAPAYVKFFGKKKARLKPVWERATDINYKCLECNVVGVNEITP